MASAVTSSWRFSVPVTGHMLSFVGVKDTTQASKVCRVFRVSARVPSLWKEFARQFHITLLGNDTRRELGDRILKVNETMRYILRYAENSAVLDANPITQYEQHCKLLQAKEDYLVQWIGKELLSVDEVSANFVFEKIRTSCDLLIDAHFLATDQFLNFFRKFSANVLIHALKQWPVDKKLKWLDMFFDLWLETKCRYELAERQFVLTTVVAYNFEETNNAFEAEAVAFFRTEKGIKYIEDMQQFIDYCLELKPNFNAEVLQNIASSLLLLCSRSTRFYKTFIRFVEVYPNYVPDPSDIDWVIKIGVAPQLITLMATGNKDGFTV